MEEIFFNTPTFIVTFDGGTTQNLGLKNASISILISSSENIGILIGQQNGRTISNCFADGIVNGWNSNGGYYRNGGLVGISIWIISNVWFIPYQWSYFKIMNGTKKNKL